MRTQHATSCHSNANGIITFQKGGFWMSHKVWRVLLLLLLFVSGSILCSPHKKHLTILHTNDTHSTLFPYGPLDDWGGIARISTLIKEMKAESSNVLTLNTGDVFVGTFEFNKYLGYPELKIMEGLYDVMCLGNHEFDLGLEALLGVLSGQIGGGQPVSLPILCANVNLAGVPPLQNFVKPHIVKHVATAPWDLEERWQLDRPERDTALGNLVADAIREAVSGAGYPADIGLEANGYITYKIHQGKVVGNDVMKAVPYGYDPVSGLGFKLDTVLLAGAQILAGLEYSVSMVEYTDDASMQVSGLSFEYDSTRTPIPPDQLLAELMKGNWGRVNPFSVKINGQPLDLWRTYWFALTEQLHKFLLANDLVPFASMETGLFEYNAVRDCMARLKVLNYTAEGRIVDTSVQE
jgi:2',3'-cyclic-nucleotide 2'-phosphodiesterase (5'-nucleotidase family)